MTAGGFKPEKKVAEAALAQGVGMLRKLQEKLYAQNNWGVLLIFQALDAAGKGGAVEHVMSGVDPAGRRSVRLQGAIAGGPRSRLHVAELQAPCRSVAASASSTGPTTKKS